jgi:hypothetical protein
MSHGLRRRIVGVDIASLVLAVDSTQVDKGTASLDALARAGNPATATTGMLAKAGLALSAAFATATAAAIAMTKHAIDHADAMNDIHLKTGLALKDLAAYELLAKQSGSSVEGMAQGFKFLGRSMTDNRTELADLGVTSKDTNVAMGQFADVISRMNDPALRTTLAMKYLGRAGVELIPTLIGGSAAIEEARKNTEHYGEKLEKAGPLADHFNDNLVLMKEKSAVLGMTIAVELLPRLNRVTDAMIEAGKHSGSLASAWTGLSETFKQVFNPLLAIPLSIGAAWTEVSITFNNWMASVSTGNAKANFLATAAEEAKNLARQYKQIADLDVSGAGTAAKHAAEVKKMTAAEEEYIRTAEARAAAAKKAAEAHTEAVKKSKEFVAGLEKEGALMGASTAEKKLYEASVIALTLTKGKERNAFVESTSALIRDNDEKERSMKIMEDADKRTVESADKLSATTQKTIDATKAMRDDTEEMGLSEDALLALKQARIDTEIAQQKSLLAWEDEYTAASYANTAIRENIAALEDRKKALGEAKVIKEQVTLWQSVEQAGHDAFMHIGESGKSTFDRLKQTLQNGLLEMLYQMTMKKWIVNIQTEITGAAAASAASGGGGGLFGALGNLLGLGGVEQGSVPYTGGVDAVNGLDLGWMPSFAGGGSTGDGSRSGGMDGQGGFLAMMHPQETVTDHAKGGGNGDVSISMPVEITIQGNADGQVVAQALAALETRIYRNVPAIIRRAQIRNRVSPTV